MRNAGRTPLGAPRAAVVAARDDVGQVLAGLQVTEAQLVDLVAGAVHGVREQPVVGTDQGQAELQVARVVGEQVGVQQQLRIRSSPPPPRGPIGVVRVGLGGLFLDPAVLRLRKC